MVCCTLSYEMGQKKPVPASAGHIDTDVADDEDDFRRRMRLNVAMASGKGFEIARAIARMRRGQHA
jgi:hypothetical protein